jgi:hypothetical protein
VGVCEACFKYYWVLGGKSVYEIVGKEMCIEILRSNIVHSYTSNIVRDGSR